MSMLRKYLAEAVVLNTDFVDRWVARFANAAKSEEAKQWWTKRLRAYILNTPAVLTAAGPSDIPPNAPPYVRMAIDKGEPVYTFQGKDGQFQDRLQHIQDFFNSLAEYSVRKPTNNVEAEDVAEAKKWLSKLQKMTIEQVEQAEQQWAAKAGARSKSMTKEGCEVIHRWEDGMYAVRYTDPNTMIRDGHDLQNCLRYGNYWDAVRTGQQWVVSIRKPNDEAVVGMRWTLRNGKPVSIEECKGKNNKPAGPNYVPYIVDLLPRFGISNMTHDLESAGIHANHGKYGTFKDVATNIKLNDQIEYWRTDDRFTIRVGRKEFGGTMTKGIITGLLVEGIDTQTICRGLTAINPGPNNRDFGGLARQVRTQLFNIGVFQGERGFGSAKEVGQQVGTIPGIREKVVVSRITAPEGDGYLVFEGNESFVVNVTNNLVVTLDERLFKMVEPGQIFNGFNLAGVKGNNVFDNSYSFRYGFVLDKSGYRPVENVADKVGTVDGVDVWDFQKKVWLFGKRDRGFEGFRLARGNVLDAIISPRGDTVLAGKVARLLAQKNKFTKIEGIALGRAGILQIGESVIADPKGFVDAVVGLGKDGIWGPPHDKFPVDPREFGTYLENAGLENLGDKDLERLFNAVDPVTNKKFMKTEKGEEFTVFSKKAETETIIVPTLAFWLQSLWAKNDTYKARILNTRAIVQEKLIEYMDKNEGKMFRLQAVYGPSENYNNAERLLPDAFAKAKQHRDAVERALRDASASVPSNASAADRYAALNSLRDLDKNKHDR